VVTALHRSKHVVSRTIVNAWIVTGQNEGCVPIKTVSRWRRWCRTGRCFTIGSLRRAWANGGRFAGAEISPTHGSVLTLVVHEIGIERIDTHDKAITARDRDPFFV